MWGFAGVCFALAAPPVRTALESVFAEASVVFVNSLAYVCVALAAIFAFALLYSLTERKSETAAVPTHSRMASQARSTSTASRGGLLENMLFLGSLVMPLGVAVAASGSDSISTSTSGTSSASNDVPWTLADNATNLALLQANLTMCTYSKVEECIKDPQTVAELGKLVRAPGHCAAFDSAYVSVTSSVYPVPNRYYPTSVKDAYDAGFSNKFSEWSDDNQEQFQVDCPLLYDDSIAKGEDLLCCTEQQYTGLSTQVRMIPGLCTSCKENLRNIFCQFTCNPNNSMYLDFNEVRLMPGGEDHPDAVFPAAEEVTYYVGKDWIRDIYDFCEDDSSFSILCNPNDNCVDGYGLMESMGKYSFNSIGSPLQINMTTMDKLPESVQESEFCHCDDTNQTGCFSPMNNRLESCVGVCGSLCAVSSSDSRTYIDACFGAEKASASGSSSAVVDATWFELNSYLASNLSGVDFTALNYFLVMFGGIVGLFLILCFIYATCRKQKYGAVGQQSTADRSGPYTPGVAGAASTGVLASGRLSYLDELLTTQLKRWGVFVSTGKHPRYIIPMVLVFVIVCSVGLYRIEVETDPVKLWVSTASTSYRERQHYGDIFMPFYRAEQLIMVPKDSGDIYRSDVLKEAIRVQNLAANVTYTSDDGSETVALDDICWKATGTECTVNSITQYFQNNMEHFEFYAKYGYELTHFSNCLYSPANSDVTTCTSLRNALKDGDSIPSTMSDCPCLSTFGSPMNLYNTYLGGFPDGAETNYTLFLESKALVSSYLNYNYADAEKNDPVIKWEREYIKLMKELVANNTVFDLYFYAEISVQDEVDAESSNGMGPVVLSYCLMIIYISLGINRFKFSKDFFISSKILVGFLGVFSIVLGVASTIGIYMWAGVKLQLIIMEVVPFLSLAIGVDNIFLLVNAMARKEEELKQAKPHLFMNLENNPKLIEEITTTLVSEAVSYIGPSIAMASTAEAVAFAFGAISPMPVVLWFAAMACCAVALNFFFQMTLFLSILTLDKHRELSGRYDLIFKRASSVNSQMPVAGPETDRPQQSQQPLVSMQQPKTPEADEVPPTPSPVLKSQLTVVLNRCVDAYACFLSLKIVKLIVLLLFLAWTLVSIYSIESLDHGLPQKEAMPSDSYMIEYFNALDVYLATGSPVYFIVETGYEGNPDTYELNSEDVEALFCKSKDICGTYSIPNIMNALANVGNKTITHISPGTTYSWMDDFWGFVNPDSECCRVSSEGAYVAIESGNDTYSALRSRDATCLSTSVSVPPVPEAEYMSLFSMFATASAGTSCSYGGGSIYRGQFSVDGEPLPVITDSTPAVVLNKTSYGDEITAWSYMVTGTANPTQQRYIDSYKQNLAAAEWITAKTGVNVWVYSLTYVYFEQYLTIIADTYKLVGLSLAAIFVITTMYLGSVFYSLVIALAATNVVVLVMGLMQPLDILLNGLSMVNLIIAAGIAVEFCGHYVRMFAKARGTGDERAKDALRRVLVSVLFGITITKVVGLSVLTLADSRVFKKYYFRMYMMVVLCGLLTGMVLLPVLLSTIVDVRDFFWRKRSEKNETPSAPVTRVD